MTRHLFFQAIIKFFAGLFCVGILIFVPAGTVRFWNGWLLIGILFVPMFIAGLILMFRNPGLLEKRLNAGEKEKEQKQVVLFSGLIFLSAFILAGLNFRFSWIVMPDLTVRIAAGVFLLSYLLYAEVLRENTYLSRTIEIQESQRVIDTGLYGIVRHPMYMATVFLFLSIPLVLGSPLSFLIMMLYLPIIGKRIRNEEMILENGLQGYREYKSRVRYKVIPYIW